MQPPVADAPSGHHRAPRPDPGRRLRLAARQGHRRGDGHLEAENAYTEDRTAHLADLRQTIFDEIKARTLETDLSVPTRNRGHWYYGRSFEGKEYGASCRVPVADPDDWTPPRPDEDATPDQPALPGEEVLLDLDALAEGHEFFSLGGSSVSPDGTLLAYSTDVVGDERYTIRVKDLADRRARTTRSSGVIGGATWDRAGEHLYYTTVDDVLALRQGLAAPLGTTQADDELVHHETDERFFVGVGPHPQRPVRHGRRPGRRPPRSTASSTPTPPTTGFPVFAERREGLEYSLDHAVLGGEDVFLVLHNAHGPGLRARHRADRARPRREELDAR